MHTGEAETPKQDAKWAFLDAMEKRMPQLKAASPSALIMGDLNVGHRELDIRNWKGNIKKAGFLPRERAYFDRFLGEDGAEVTGVDGSTGPGLGWVDIGRRFHGEVDGPYTWWSSRGKRVRHRHRVAHRLPPGDAGPRRARHRLPGRARALVGHAVERPPPVVADYTIGPEPERAAGGASRARPY